MFNIFIINIHLSQSVRLFLIFEFKNWTKSVSYIFLKTKLNLIGNRPNQLGRFGQGISPVPQAKCLGHFACESGEMALNGPRGHFATPTGEMAPKKVWPVKPNHKLGIFFKPNHKKWNFFKINHKNRILKILNHNLVNSENNFVAILATEIQFRC